jgi:TIR domain
MNRLFLSHSSADNARAIALSQWLVKNGWGDHFLDLDPKRGIAAGERWLRAFMESLSRCEAVVFLLSPAWCRSRYCRSELDAAKGHGKRLIGVVVEAVHLDEVAGLSADWQVCDLTDGVADALDNIDIGPPLQPVATSVHFARDALGEVGQRCHERGQTLAPGGSGVRGVRVRVGTRWIWLLSAALTLVAAFAIWPVKRAK